jgi:hypothetical protein
MSIPDAAIEAAAEALDTLGSVGPNLMPEYVARAAIEAALPAIREAIAQEIEAEANLAWTAYTSAKPVDSDLLAAASEGMVDAMFAAARIVRGGSA